jgi:sugar phosphate isomerase/epimerase
MTLGFVSAILPDLALEELARFASAEGFDCLEVMCWPPGKADRRYAGVTHIDVTEDKQRLDEVGILATPLEYHTPKIPGLGEVNWGRFISVLNDVGYTGPLCIEVEDRAYEGSHELRKAALRQSARYLRQFLPGKGES